jgi:hypothetical protein
MISQLAARVEFLIEQQAAAELEKEKSKKKGGAGHEAVKEPDATGPVPAAVMAP